MSASHSEQSLQGPSRLVVLDGPNRGAVFTLLPDTNRLGRDAEADVPVLDERVSRHHADIVFEEGSYVLHDQGSRNGTYLNGVRCERAALHPGDEVRLGEVSLLFSEPRDLAATGSLAGRSTIHHAVRGPSAASSPVVAPRRRPTYMLGESPALREVERMVFRVAPHEGTVLVLGESGTGKELVARAIHRNSPRRRGPFVPLNCACLSGELLGSELFGHEAGAFTGAEARRAGVFELAEGGTLFLDEIGELPAEAQGALLRVLEKKGFRRLGGADPILPDVRLVAATHRDLRARVDEGRFRADLFFRLEVLQIALPPLRERSGDIPILARHFLHTIRRKNGRPARVISPQAMAMLEGHSWPGNVRELRNVLERISITCEDEAVGLRHLPAELRGNWRPVTVAKAGDEEAFPTLRELERDHIAAALLRSGGNKSQAARILGIDRVTLYARIKKHGIDAP